MSKRIRQVFDTDQIAHMWAHQTQLSARNALGNFSFAGRELRSYSTVIAERVENANGVAFLCLDQTWSVTTSKQQGLMRRAAYGNVFEVTRFIPEYKGKAYHGESWRGRLSVIRSAHKQNIDGMMRHAEECATSAGRARSNAERRAKTAAHWYDMAIRYVAYFNLGKIIKIKPLDVGALANEAKRRADEAKRRAQLTSQRQQAEQRKREALTALVNAELAKRLPSFVDNWRTTGNDNHAYSYAGKQYRFYSYDFRAHLGTNLMRLDGAEVVTDLNVRVSAADVRRIAPILLATMANDNPSSSPLVGRHVGAYAISSIAADSVTVGCHLFNRAEIKRILDTINASNPPADDTDGIGEHDSNRSA